MTLAEALPGSIYIFGHLVVFGAGARTRPMATSRSCRRRQSSRRSTRTKTWSRSYTRSTLSSSARRHVSCERSLLSTTIATTVRPRNVYERLSLPISTVSMFLSGIQTMIYQLSLGRVTSPRRQSGDKYALLLKP